MRSSLAIGLIFTLAACGGARGSSNVPNAAGNASTNAGLEVHDAGGRPRLAIVRRDGDPIAAIAIEVRVGDADGGARTAAIAALVAARVEAAGGHDLEVIAGASYARVRALATLDAAFAAKVQAALSSPIAANDPALPAIARALSDFASRPVFDPALAEAARCLDRPLRPASWKPIASSAIASTVDAWRAALGAGAITVGLVGKGSAVDAFSTAWRSLPAMASVPAAPASSSSAGVATFVRASTYANEAGVVVVEAGPRAALPGALASLVDPASALTLRLRAQDDWHLRSIAGAAHPEGACVVLEVEPSRPSGATWNADRATSRAAVAIEVARQEALLALAAGSNVTDAEGARLAIANGGDPREAADRAAWWAWSPRAFDPNEKPRASATFDAPLTTMAKGGGGAFDADAALSALVAKFSAAADRARFAWTRDEIELKTKVEVGQGETWIALGTPCGVANEASGDAGLAALAMHALVDEGGERASTEGVTIEAWSAVAGVGVVAHAAAKEGESPKGLAFRVADVAARTFFATFPSESSVVDARADALVRLTDDAPNAKLVHGALVSLSSDRPSWLEPLGAVDAIARVGGASLDLRLATLRAGALRMAVIVDAEGDAAQSASRAAERWVARRPGETRVCPTIAPWGSPKGGIHPVTVTSGTGVAIALPIADANVGSTLAALVDAKLAASLGGLAGSYEARFVPGLGGNAIVIVALAPDANVDAVATRLRSLLDALRTGAIASDDLARAELSRSDALLRRHLDPRARVVDLFLGDPAAVAPLELSVVKNAAATTFDEAHMQLVLARLK